MSNLPAIIGIGYTVPPFSYTQKDVFTSLGYSKHWSRMFDEAGIDKRHFLFPLQQLKTMTFQEQQEAYAHWSCVLSVRALEETVNPEDIGKIGLLVYHSCTGFMPGPTVGHYLADKFGLQDVEICNLASMGCDASWPGLRRCYDYTRLSGRLSVLIACELSDLTYFPETNPPERENDYELMRANAIFGDACSCIAVGTESGRHYPEIIDFASILDTQYIDRLGYTWRDGRLRVRLARDVPEIAQKLASAAVKKLLDKHSLELEDIAYWIIHPAGSSILDGLQRILNLSEAKMQHSREALRQFGNCSSAAIGIVGKMLLENEPDPRGYAMMVNVGPGMSGNSMLMLFP